LLIIGAGGHATEIIDELYNDSNERHFFFFDEQSESKFFLNHFTVLKNNAEVVSHCGDDFQFILGIGNPLIRKKVANRFCKIGGVLKSVISPNAVIGHFNVHIADGVDVMTNATISSNVSIGKGTLINRNASVHHDCIIGEFCEIAPNAVLLGRVKIGDLTMIGAGAVVLPGVVIGSTCIIAAGAVVTKDVQNGQTVKGIPAK
jgi:sugar O-acyltransferase (sialic acid O-acetyltransferase NeuD family)